MLAETGKRQKAIQNVSRMPMTAKYSTVLNALLKRVIQKKKG